MSRETLEILMIARSLIDDPNNWTTEASARNKEGEPVDVYSKEATCWCLIGSIYISSFAADYSPQKALDLIELLVENRGHWSPFSFNDDHSHKEMLELLDHAIEVAGRNL